MENTSNLVKGYETSAGIALDKLRSMLPEDIAAASGAEWANGLLRIEYLAELYCADLSTGQLYREATGEDVKPALKALIFQYMAAARGKKPSGELIAFRDIPGAAGYEPSFRKRALLTFVKVFDNKPELLLSCASALKGTPVQVGDAGIKLNIFPLMPVVYGLWHSDSEFPADSVILFDSTIKSFGSVELAVVSAANGVYELMRMARKTG